MSQGPYLITVYFTVLFTNMEPVQEWENLEQETGQEIIEERRKIYESAGIQYVKEH